MNEVEEGDILCRFGTPLEPLEEDEIPTKKPILIEDQIVTDENGRRRFHGAFTGGFSAGFWNTVGSLEGWTPKEFKSSRDEKFKLPQQKPTDFMDNEDFGEFGIAPQRVQTTADFTSRKKDDSGIKRKHTKNVDGPIPGVPVLHQLIEPSRDNIAVRLLKKMGWKEGQGIGARQTKREKKLNAKQNFKEQSNLKRYGCDMGPISDNAKSIKSESDESDMSDIEDITFAPDDFEPYICAAKDNCFGLDYSGLSRDPVLKQHINLFGPLEILDNKKQKLSIRGKGFGVGALEEEDDDIYHHDDLSNYDFSLDKPSNRNIKPKLKPQDLHIIEGFSSVSISDIHTKKIFIVKIPQNFAPRNWLLRKSRFEPLDEKRSAILKQQEELKIKGLGRHDITSEERGAILEGTSTKTNILEKKIGEKEKENKSKLTYLEKINQKYKTEQNKKEKLLDILASKSNNFVKSEIIQEDGTISKDESNILSEEIQKENEKIKCEASKITKNLDSTTPNTFKPFMGDSAKQERYEKFIEKHFTTDEEMVNFLSSIQPSNMSKWDRKREKKEFNQAKRMYKPLEGIMSDRFVTETTATAEKEVKNVDPDRRGKTIRIKSIWHPVVILCKRFNIAEPFVNIIKEENVIKKPKLSVFDYLESSVNKKEDFMTPVVIPNPEEIPNLDQPKSPKRLSAKDLFVKEASSNETSTPLQKSNSIEVNVSSENEILNNSMNTEKSNNYKKVIKEKPKSELEQKIEESKSKHPSEKKELYKIVFENFSDDDEDSSIKNDNEVNTIESVKKEQIESVEAKDLFAVLNRPAGEVNLLRNNSPPRGIFAAFFKDPTTTTKSEEINLEQSEIIKLNVSTNSMPEPKINLENGKNLLLQDEEFYGPKIPSKINHVFSRPKEPTAQIKKFETSSISKSIIDSKLEKLLGKHKNKKIIEEWVEVTNETTKQEKKESKKNKKKKKKEKSKHRNRSSSSNSSNSSSDSSGNSNNYRNKKKSKKSKKSKKHKHK